MNEKGRNNKRKFSILDPGDDRNNPGNQSNKKNELNIKYIITTQSITNVKNRRYRTSIKQVFI